MEIEKIDYYAQAYENSASLLQENPEFQAFLASIIDYYQGQQEDFIWLCHNLLDLDNAENWQLDLIGLVLNQSRILASFDTGIYFGFEGAYQSGTFGTVTDPEVGAVWYSSSAYNPANSKKLTDDQYRRILKARSIKKMSQYCSQKELLEVINLLSNTNTATIDVPEQGSLIIYCDDTEGFVSYYLSRLKTFDNILPIPLGIRVSLRGFNSGGGSGGDTTKDLVSEFYPKSLSELNAVDPQIPLSAIVNTFDSNGAAIGLVGNGTANVTYTLTGLTPDNGSGSSKYLVDGLSFDATVLDSMVADTAALPATTVVGQIVKTYQSGSGAPENMNVDIDLATLRALASAYPRYSGRVYVSTLNPLLGGDTVHTYSFNIDFTVNSVRYRTNTQFTATVDFEASTTPEFGEWVINSNVLYDSEYQNAVYSAYKTDGVDYYDSTAFTTTAIAVNRSVIANDLNTHPAFVRALEELIGQYNNESYTYTIDPTTATVKFVRTFVPSDEFTVSRGDEYVWRYIHEPTGDIYNWSYNADQNDLANKTLELWEGIAPFYFDQVSNIIADEGGTFIYAYLASSQNTQTRLNQITRQANPNYTPSFGTEESFPTSDVTDRIRMNATSSDSSISGPARDYIDLVSKSFNAEEASKRYILLADLRDKFEQNKTLRG